jgi:hypothetical protein
MTIEHNLTTLSNPIYASMKVFAGLSGTGVHIPRVKDTTWLRRVAQMIMRGARITESNCQVL